MEWIVWIVVVLVALYIIAGWYDNRVFGYTALGLIVVYCAVSYVSHDLFRRACKILSAKK